MAEARQQHLLALRDEAHFWVVPSDFQWARPWRAARINHASHLRSLRRFQLCESCLAPACVLFVLTSNCTTEDLA